MWQLIVEIGFPIVQAAGVAGSLFYAGRSFELDRRARRTEVYLSLTEAHRELWENMIEHPRLARVLDPLADTVSQPITVEENRFVILLCVHVAAVHRAMEDGAYESSPGMEQDIRELMALPIPAQILRDILPYQTESFRRYLGGLMDPEKGAGRNGWRG